VQQNVERLVRAADDPHRRDLAIVVALGGREPLRESAGTAPCDGPGPPPTARATIMYACNTSPEPTSVGRTVRRSPAAVSPSA